MLMCFLSPLCTDSFLTLPQPLAGKLEAEQDADKKAMLQRLLTRVKGAVDEVDRSLKVKDSQEQEHARQVRSLRCYFAVCPLLYILMFSLLICMCMCACIHIEAYILHNMFLESFVMKSLEFIRF